MDIPAMTLPEYSNQYTHVNIEIKPKKQRLLWYKAYVLIWVHKSLCADDNTLISISGYTYNCNAEVSLLLTWISIFTNNGVAGEVGRFSANVK